MKTRLGVLTLSRTSVARKHSKMERENFKRAANWSEAEVEALERALAHRNAGLNTTANSVEANMRKKRLWEQVTRSERCRRLSPNC